MLKFKKGDTVKITAGKDKGREGKIVNLYKKHVKGFGDVKGGVYDIPRPLGYGKVALICPKCKKMTRVGFGKAGDEKVRICKKCKKEIDSK